MGAKCAWCGAAALADFGGVAGFGFSLLKWRPQAESSSLMGFLLVWRGCPCCGEVSEWLKEHAWKACVGATQPWVRIPPSPPYLNKSHPIVLFISALQNATFFVAIVEPCIGLQRGTG